MLPRLIKSVLLVFTLCVSGCSERVELNRQLSEQEANEVIAELANKQVKAKKKPTKNGVSVSVNAQDFSRSIKALEAAGLPRAARSTLGDIFRKEGVISTPLEERARYIYALSQELEATLSKIDGVIVARVHVVLAERVAPGEPVQPASASVFIKHNAQLDPDSIQSRVRRLVASSIPSMATALDNPDKITTVFVPSAEFQEKQQLLFFGPFLVPEQNLGFWKAVFVSLVTGLILIMLALAIWLYRLWRSRHTPGSRSPPEPCEYAP